MSDAVLPMLRLDIRSLLATGRSWLLFLAVLAAVPLAAGADMAVPMAAAGGMLTGMSLFALDETHRLRLLYGGLPVRRRTVVVSHYAVTALVLTAFVGVGVLVALVAGTVRREPPADLGLVAATSLGALLLFSALMLPAYVRFGTRTASIVVLSAMMLAIGGGVLLRDSALVGAFWPQAVGALTAAGPAVVLALPLLGVVALAASCLAAIRIYERQDH